MNYKPYQTIIIGSENDNKDQLIEIPGAEYLRIQSDPNNIEFRIQVDNQIDDDNSIYNIYLDKTGSYEMDLRGIGLMNTVYLRNLKFGQQVIIDTLRQASVKGVR